MSEVFTSLQLAEIERNKMRSNQIEPHAQPPLSAVSADDFSALEQRIMRVTEIVRRERAGRLLAEERANKAEAMLINQVQRAEELELQLREMNGTQDTMLQRVKGFLDQLDALEL